MNPGVKTDAGPSQIGGIVPGNPIELDPAQVYLIGSIGPGKAIADPAFPDTSMAGFDSSVNERSARIHPISGQLFYIDNEWAIRQFVCDEACTYVPSPAMEASIDWYPENPLANDPVDDDNGCTGAVSGVQRFEFSADGERFHNCISEASWRDTSNTVFFEPAHTNEEVIAFQKGGAFLSGWNSVTYQLFLRQVDDPNSIIEVETDHNFFVTARPHDDGYWVVFADLKDENILYSLSLDGQVTNLGQFPKLPAGYAARQDNFAILDGSATLWIEASPVGADGTGFIFSRTMQGTPTTVYTEDSDPLVRMHGSTLLSITGSVSPFH